VEISKRCRAKCTKIGGGKEEDGPDLTIELNYHQHGPELGQQTKNQNSK
jgi:hypothetical protein